MAILCRPAITVPEHVITLEDTLGLARRLHAGHPQLDLALRLIENTGVLVASGLIAGEALAMSSVARATPKRRAVRRAARTAGT